MYIERNSRDYWTGLVHNFMKMVGQSSILMLLNRWCECWVTLTAFATGTNDRLRRLIFTRTVDHSRRILKKKRPVYILL